MTIGPTAVTIGFALTLRLDSNPGFLDLLPSLLLLGVAFAVKYGRLTASAVEGVEARHHGVAGGIVCTGLQFGAALGVSIARPLFPLGTSTWCWTWPITGAH